MKGNEQTSNASLPFPITPFRPLTKSPVAPSSCSMLLCQSSLPVHSTTCSEYAAIVLSRGVLRSMSRSGGVEAHSHVGDGHVCVVGIAGGGVEVEGVDWRIEDVDSNLSCRIRGVSLLEQRPKAIDIVECVKMREASHVKCTDTFGTRSAPMTPRTEISDFGHPPNKLHLYPPKHSTLTRT
jgi:hypothetical protein